MIKKILKSIDYSLIIIALILFGIGIIALHSANGGVNGNMEEVTKQLIWFGIGLVCMFIMMIIDYEIYKKIWIPIYLLTVVSLILVLFTKPIYGARSWFTFNGVSIQPGEIAKITLIVGIGRLLEHFKEKGKINNPFCLIVVLAYVAIPFILLVLQPDYGTAMVFLVVAAVMIFISGIGAGYIIGAIITCVVGVFLAYHYILPQHAINRINVFLNPGSDPKGAGYNIIQAELAVGSGQMWGMGIHNGNQSQLGYLPMKTTDFIYAVISEEMGFVMSTLVVVLFVLLIGKSIHLAKTAKDDYGALIVVGIAGMFLAHFVENVGMNIGLMPITGIPLPFISYGGSSMLTNFVGLGMILNVSAKRNKKMFE